ncbi:MAG TPA: nuclear transport factor 2 family protein [Pyrinomonadaceae bacterium]|nr:nuclear transport factor 2 family protein [Pyrinomonadaceae bacterium]
MAAHVAVKSAPLPRLEELAELERKWIEALLKRDRETLDHLLAENFLVFTPTGKLNKGQCLDQMSSSDLVLESIVNEDAVVRDYGVEAIVSGIVKLKGRYKGVDLTGRYAYRCSQARLDSEESSRILIADVKVIP